MPIRYDEKYVKRPNEELEYSPEQIEELMKCQEDCRYFIKYIKIVSPDTGEIEFIPYDYQRKLIGTIQKYRYSVGLWSRQSGKTTVVGAYCLWFALFNRDKVIGIVSNKESSAKMILSRIKRMYECLPMWLKPGVLEYQKTGIVFDNGTRMVISATSPDAFRGETINLLVCDEFAFVPGNQAEEFWAANYPTISASKTSKIIIISTPNGMFNIFHRIYNEATLKKNTFMPTKVTWQAVPGRDQEWADEQMKNLGERQFAQEFAVEFIGSTNTLIAPNVLEVILQNDKEPKQFDLQRRLKIWEKPQKSASYVLGCDPAKGTGENFSAIQVLRVDSISPVKMKQAAVFHDNLTDVYEFAEIIRKLAIFYNNAFIMVENNGEGASVANRLWWDYEYENLVNSGSKNNSIGIRSTGGEKTGTKPKAALLLKKIIEDGSLEISDELTLRELGSYIEENGKFFGKDTGDDLVSALYWATYILEMDIFDDKYKFIEKKEDDDIWGILSDIEDFAEDWSWLDEKNPFMD